MPRKPRLQTPGVPLHIVQRGHSKSSVFCDDEDFHTYLKALQHSLSLNPVTLHAYALMSNHVHLLLTPYSGMGASRFMHALNVRYGKAFNKRWQRSGSVWEGRYKSRVLKGDRDLFACMRYIDMNPVEAGIALKPENYRWSSHRHYRNSESIPLITEHCLFETLGNTPTDRASAYLQMFNQVMEVPPDITRY